LQSFVTNLAVKVGEMTTEVKISTIAILQRSAADPMEESGLLLKHAKGKCSSWNHGTGMKNI